MPPYSTTPYEAPAPSTCGDRIEIEARVNRVFGSEMEVGLIVYAYKCG